MQGRRRYWPSAATFLLVIILLVSPSVNCKEECTQVSGDPLCVCAMSNGKKIDLRGLASHGGHAAFTNIKGKEANTVYSYNPCYSFTDEACDDVAGCQNAGGAKRSIGVQNKAKFKTDKNGVFIAYGGGKDGRDMMKYVAKRNQNMVVRLLCSESQKTPTMKYLNETTTDQKYEFQLTSECACPGACNGGGGGNHHSSIKKIGIPGLIILSILVILIVVYFVAGMIILRVKYDRTGSDIIPNKGFWKAIPFLVKDGCVFTFTPCIRCYQARSKGYSKF